MALRKAKTSANREEHGNRLECEVSYLFSLLTARCLFLGNDHRSRQSRKQRCRRTEVVIEYASQILKKRGYSFASYWCRFGCGSFCYRSDATL